MNDTRHEAANLAAAQICNLLAGDYPGGKSELYSKIYKLIMHVMLLADEESAARWTRPSNN
jgi:hypothetical protein